MRVLHLASWYPNKVHSQLGNFVFRHIEAVSSEVECMVLHVWPAPVVDGQPYPQDEPGNGDADVITRVAYVRDKAPRRWRTERAYMKLIGDLMSEGYKPDLIHLHIAAEAAKPALKAAELWQVPLVVSENWTAYHTEHGRSFRAKEERAVRKVLRAADMHLPVSQHLGAAMSQYAPSVVQRVIPNVVSGPFERPLNPRTSHGPLKLLHVSSMVDAHKDIRGMIRAVGEAVQQGVDLVLDCIGGAGEGGNEVAAYQSMVLSMGLEGRVQFSGPAGADAVATAMKEADVFVLFSRYENLPCVLLEAWMTGLPTLATDVGGVGEHLGIHPELGTLLKSGDEQGLADALVYWNGLKQASEWPDGAAIAEYAQSRFTAEAVGRAYTAAYRSVLG